MEKAVEEKKDGFSGIFFGVLVGFVVGFLLKEEDKKRLLAFLKEKFDEVKRGGEEKIEEIKGETVSSRPTQARKFFRRKR